MELLHRVGRLIQANLNQWIKPTTDPEELLEQQLYNLQEDLVRLRQAVAAAIATQKRCERQYQQALALAEEWQRRAHLALQQGDEALARAALQHRQSHLEQTRLWQSQLEQQRQTIRHLRQQMTELEIKVAEAKARRDLYVARARAAEASRNLHQVMAQISPQHPTSAFERMAEKVHQLEAEAAAVAELNAPDELEARFAALERSREIEQQLEWLQTSRRDRSHPV